MADQGFFGKSYLYKTSKGIRPIGVIRGVGEPERWIVAGSDGRHRVRAARVAPCSDAQELQRALDAWAAEQHLVASDDPYVAEVEATGGAGAAAHMPAPDRNLPAEGRTQRFCPPEEMSVDARVDLIRESLDKMEAIQLQFASGAVFVGLELLALKKQLPHGEFGKVFGARIERPRFSYRTANVYMNAAERLRTKMLKGGAVDLSDLWDVAPSDLSETRRVELSEAVGNLVNGRTLSQLLLDMGGRGGAKPGKPEKGAGRRVEHEAYRQLWDDLQRRLAIEGLQRKSWKHLDKPYLRALRHCLSTVLREIPEVEI